jgi:hypothetical protein
MNTQSDRESFDKRIADLVAHKTPDEMAKELLNLQDAQAKNAEAENNPPPEEPVAPGPDENEARAQGIDDALADEGDDTDEDSEEELDDEDLPEDDGR